MKMGLHIICCGSSTKYAVDPPHQTQNKQYLSCYSTDFDETLKVGSWDLLNPIPHRGNGRNGTLIKKICLYVRLLVCWLTRDKQVKLPEGVGAFLNLRLI